MPTKKEHGNSFDFTHVSASAEELMLAALERGDDNLQTGRFLVTYKNGEAEKGKQSLISKGLRVADARDFTDQAIKMEAIGDADAIHFHEIGVGLISGQTAREQRMDAQAGTVTNSAVESIDPEYFVFPNQISTPFDADQPETSNEYLRGFLKAAETISQDIIGGQGQSFMQTEETVEVLGATWGLIACKVPPSVRSGLGIKVAVLDTGMDLGHPDFVSRPITTHSFVGQPVQDLNGHGTQLTGTACGPKAPAGNIPRYGIGFKTNIFEGKVLTNAGSGAQAGVLAGMNWAIANRCSVILVALGASTGVQPSYTAAGQAALSAGCLIIAAAGASGGATGAPANSPTVMSVAALNQLLAPASFSNMGKIEIAAPGVDIFSSCPRPQCYCTSNGTSAAAAHVAGCAALWAETSPNLRGKLLWAKLLTTAKKLPFPSSRVGAGLVQAP